MQTKCRFRLWLQGRIRLRGPGFETGYCPQIWVVNIADKALGRIKFRFHERPIDEQRQAATEPIFSTTVLASCYEATLLSAGAGASEIK